MEVSQVLGDAVLAILISNDLIAVKRILHDLALAKDAATTSNAGGLRMDCPKLAKAIKVAARKLKRATGLYVDISDQIAVMEACAERLLDIESVKADISPSGSINPAAALNGELVKLSSLDCAVDTECDRMRRSGINVPRQGWELSRW